MDFQSRGRRILLIRSRYDRPINARREDVVGFISKDNLEVRLKEGVELSAAEQRRCDAYLVRLGRSEGLLDEVTFLSLAETTERLGRYLDNLTDPAERLEAARTLLFAASELARQARKYADLYDGDLADMS